MFVQQDEESYLLSYVIHMVKQKLSMGKYNIIKCFRLAGVNINYRNLNKVIVQTLQNNPFYLYSVLNREFVTLSEIVKNLVEGTIVTITGAPGMGKTNLALVIAENMPVKHIIANLPLKNKNTYFIQDSETLLETLSTLKTGNIVIFDDLEYFASSHQSPFSAISKFFDETQVFIRKSNSVFIYIAPHYEHLLKSLRRYSRYVLYKINQKSALVYGKTYPYPKLLVNIPKTTLHYDTYYRSTFHFKRTEKNSE